MKAFARFDWNAMKIVPFLRILRKKGLPKVLDDARV